MVSSISFTSFVIFFTPLCLSAMDRPNEISFYHQNAQKNSSMLINHPFNYSLSSCSSNGFYTKEYKGTLTVTDTDTIPFVGFLYCCMVNEDQALSVIYAHDKETFLGIFNQIFDSKIAPVHSHISDALFCYAHNNKDKNDADFHSSITQSVTPKLQTLSLYRIDQEVSFHGTNNKLTCSFDIHNPDESFYSIADKQECFTRDNTLWQAAKTLLWTLKDRLWQKK